jgi:hypothetical protein
MAGNRIVAAYVPINERTYINGYAELMGYLGVKSKDVLIKDYIEEGLRPKIYKRKNRWRRDVVDKFVEDHDEYQEVSVRPGRSKKQA